MFIVPRLRKDPIQVLHLTTIIRFCAVNITDVVVAVAVVTATSFIAHFSPLASKVTMLMQLISSFWLLLVPMVVTVHIGSYVRLT